MNSMAWLALFVWAGVPLLALLFGMLLWRRSRTPMRKALALTVGVAVLSAPLLVSNGVKAYYDRQVREMCAKDGGVRVYETVRLPAEKFNQWGQPNFYRPTQGQNALGSEYTFKQETHYYKYGNPEMSRRLYQVFRRVDNKLIGEAISYGRVGGDLPGQWHHSSFHCPADYGDIPLLVKIFVPLNQE